MLSSDDVMVKLIGNDPWQQFVKAVNEMLSDASDDVAQIGLGIKTIQFGGAGQGVDCSAPFAAAVGTEVQEVFSVASKFAIILPIPGRKLKSATVARSERPRASGEYAAICSMPSCASARPNYVGLLRSILPPASGV
jgi:hypothetical protein